VSLNGIFRCHGNRVENAESAGLIAFGVVARGANDGNAARDISTQNGINNLKKGNSSISLTLSCFRKGRFETLPQVRNLQQQKLIRTYPRGNTRNLLSFARLKARPVTWKTAG